MANGVGACGLDASEGSNRGGPFGDARLPIHRGAWKGCSWLPLTAIPYFYLYARDLSLGGRRFWDVLAVYAFNLMLIPIQLGGVVKSLHQAITGAKTPFSRTPKVLG